MLLQLTETRSAVAANKEATTVMFLYANEGLYYV